jgi:hypothetical protein
MSQFITSHILSVCCIFLLLSCSGPPSISTSLLPTETPPTAAPTPSQEPPLAFFTSEPGKFQVWLPASESIQNYTLKKTLFGEAVECPIISFGLNSASAFVQYCDLAPQSITSLSEAEVLDQARDEVLSDMRTKLDATQRSIAQGTYPSLSLAGQTDMRGMGYDGTFKARMILARNRLYLVAMSVYHENWCGCRQQMDQVVDSLYIDPELSIPFEPTP